jgi:hypothetical protein
MIIRRRATRKGKLVGRVLTEAMPNGAMPRVQKEAIRSEPDGSGRMTEVLTQTVEGTRYFDAAGYPGLSVGLPADPTLRAADAR